jgi:hypothetical protein
MKNVDTIQFLDLTKARSRTLPARIERQQDEDTRSFLRRKDFLVWKADREELQAIYNPEDSSLLVIVGFPGMGYDFD